MKMAQGKCNSQGIEFGSVFRELSCLSKMHEKFATSHEFHDEEDFLLGLEDVLHTNQERMISFLQDLLLKQC